MISSQDTCSTCSVYQILPIVLSRSVFITSGFLGGHFRGGGVVPSNNIFRMIFKLMDFKIMVPVMIYSQPSGNLFHSKFLVLARYAQKYPSPHNDPHRIEPKKEVEKKGRVSQYFKQ